MIQTFINEWLGTPFLQNGRSHKGIDCVGLLLEYFKFRGVELERVDYVYVMTSLRHFVEKTDKLEEGAIVLLEGDNRYVNHVGICINNTQMIHATKSTGVAIMQINPKVVRGIYKIK